MVMITQEQVASILNNPNNIELKLFALNKGVQVIIPALNYKKVTEDLNNLVDKRK